MALIGYRAGSVYLCRSCADDADIPTNALREVRDSQYSHGDGGGPCAQCGLDVLDILARNVLRGRTHGGLATPDDASDQVDAVEATAQLIDLTTSARPAVTLAPGEEPARKSVAPGVEIVSHPETAAETLRIEIDATDHPPGCGEDPLERVERMLSAWQWRYTVESAPEDAPHEHDIIAVPEDHPLCPG